MTTADTLILSVWLTDSRSWDYQLLAKSGSPLCVEMSCQSNGESEKVSSPRDWSILVYPQASASDRVVWCTHKLYLQLGGCMSMNRVKCKVLTLMVSSSDMNGPTNMYTRVTKDSGGNWVELPTTSPYSNSGAEHGTHSLNQQMTTAGLAGTLAPSTSSVVPLLYLRICNVLGDILLVTCFFNLSCATLSLLEVLPLSKKIKLTLLRP